jgi:hypothetical protein
MFTCIICGKDAGNIYYRIDRDDKYFTGHIICKNCWNEVVEPFLSKFEEEGWYVSD